MDNKVIIFSAPSGAGKSTIVNHILGLHPEIEFSISATSRAPRGQEQHGKEYYFFTADEFRQMIAEDKFVEHEEVYPGSFYGTLRSEVERIWAKGHVIVFDIDVQGAMQIREAAAKDAELAAVLQFVFIAPPSYEVLEKRLRGRQTDSEEQIAIRLGAAKKEISFWKNYDYAVINGDLSQAAAEMIALFRSFRLRTALLEQSDLLD